VLPTARALSPTLELQLLKEKRDPNPLHDCAVVLEGCMPCGIAAQEGLSRK